MVDGQPARMALLLVDSQNGSRYDQKPNRKPSDYYRETYVETFANISAETFAEKETKTAEASEWLSDNFKYFGPGFKSFIFIFILY
jgi:hypothetical protein